MGPVFRPKFLLLLIKQLLGLKGSPIEKKTKNIKQVNAEIAARLPAKNQKQLEP